MKILLIGSGGREHALAWKLSQSKKVKKIYVSPGNAGTQLLSKCENILLLNNKDRLNFAIKNEIDLTIVGPEQPLVEGIVDLFEKNNLKIFGPNKFAAQLEGSKIFAKKFMIKNKIATAKYCEFNNPIKAKQYLHSINFPIVIKADGLAAGKGVNICFNMNEAIKTINDFMVNNIFKGAGLKIIIEEYLQGVEASIICVTDSKTIVPLMSAKDYKTIYENNVGANTGGMGAICPNPYVTNKVLEDFKSNIMDKTLQGIKKTKINYKGFVFFGVMITKKGCKLLEYNVRMGDPECQSIMMMINFDLVDLFLSIINRRLKTFKMKWKKGNAINVVLTSKGYPNQYDTNQKILVKNNPLIFFAGTKLENNSLITSGGRVLSIVKHSSNLTNAIKEVYKEIKNVSFNGMHYRKDIGS